MGVSHGDHGMGQWTEILSRMKDLRNCGLPVR